MKSDVKIPVDATASTAPTRASSNTVRIINLVIGDALVFLIFSAIGRRSHGEAVGLNALWQIVLTAAPFAMGWFLVSPWIGAYKRGLAAQPKKMAARTATAWVASWPVAMALRGIFVDHAIPPLTFALITLVVNMLLLLVWRVPYALWGKSKQQQGK